MAEHKHSLDPVREALREFEEAIRAESKKLVGSKVMERQEVSRSRERVIEAIMDLVRQTLKDRGVEVPQADFTVKDLIQAEDDEDA